jgi:hypothetical protein
MAGRGEGEVVVKLSTPEGGTLHLPMSRQDWIRCFLEPQPVKTVARRRDKHILQLQCSALEWQLFNQASCCLFAAKEPPNTVPDESNQGGPCQESKESPQWGSPHAMPSLWEPAGVAPDSAALPAHQPGTQIMDSQADWHPRQRPTAVTVSLDTKTMDPLQACQPKDRGGPQYCMVRPPSDNTQAPTLHTPTASIQEGKTLPWTWHNFRLSVGQGWQPGRHPCSLQEPEAAQAGCPLPLVAQGLLPAPPSFPPGSPFRLPSLSPAVQEHAPGGP